MHQYDVNRICILILLFGFARSSVAQTDYFSEKKDVVVIEHSRTANEKKLILGLMGTGVILSGVGLLFHLDSNALSNEVGTPRGLPTGQTYTQEIDDKRSQAFRSRNFAITGYSIGLGLFVAGLTTYFLTDPGHMVVEKPGFQANLSFSEDELWGHASWTF